MARHQFNSCAFLFIKYFILFPWNILFYFHGIFYFISVEYLILFPWNILFYFCGIFYFSSMEYFILILWNILFYFCVIFLWNIFISVGYFCSQLDDSERKCKIQQQQIFELKENLAHHQAEIKLKNAHFEGIFLFCNLSK